MYMLAPEQQQQQQQQQHYLYVPTSWPLGANTMHVLYSLPSLRSGIEPPNNHTPLS